MKKKLALVISIGILVAAAIGTVAAVTSAGSCGPARPFTFDRDLLEIKKPTILHVQFDSHSSFFKPVGVNKAVKVLYRGKGDTLRNARGSGWEYDWACRKPKGFLSGEIKNGNLKRVSPKKLRQTGQAVRA